MANKKTPADYDDNLQGLVDSIRTNYKLEGAPVKKDEVEVTDIIDFCNNPKFLDLPKNNLNLWFGQVIILKVYYMGSRGNEDTELTDEEWKWLYDHQLDNVIAKIKMKTDGVDKGQPHNFNFRELHLALGRRSSKTVMASIIATYEAYKLLCVQGGDPYTYYNIPYDEEIALINVANSQKQAKRLFAQVKSRIRNCPFFRGRIDGEPSSDEIRVFTDVDLRKKADPDLIIPVSGSVVLVCGHSNPDTLRGYSASLILFDELAYYDEGTVVSGSDFYDALKPSIAKFTTKGEGRLVELSSTGPTSGIFYTLCQQANSLEPEFSSMVSFRLATWDINEDLPYDCEFLTTERGKNPDSFNVEFGAQWKVKGMISNYFPRALVESCIKPSRAQMMRPIPGMDYFMHLDPASDRDHYALVVVYREPYTTIKGAKRHRVILAYHKTWEPSGKTLNLADIDEEVIDIWRIFKPVSVTYDTWNSVHSINHLQKKGIRASQISFGRGQKATYYQNLSDLMERDEFHIYYDEKMVGELLSLKYKNLQRGVSIHKDPRADINTDDIADCLAGASWMAVGRIIKNTLPSSVLATMGGLSGYNHQRP